MEKHQTDLSAGGWKETLSTVDADYFKMGKKALVIKMDSQCLCVPARSQAVLVSLRRQRRRLEWCEKCAAPGRHGDNVARLFGG